MMWTNYQIVYESFQLSDFKDRLLPYIDIAALKLSNDFPELFANSANRCRPYTKVSSSQYVRMQVYVIVSKFNVRVCPTVSISAFTCHCSHSPHLTIHDRTCEFCR